MTNSVLLHTALASRAVNFPSLFLHFHAFSKYTQIPHFPCLVQPFCFSCSLFQLFSEDLGTDSATDVNPDLCPKLQPLKHHQRPTEHKGNGAKP